MPCPLTNDFVRAKYGRDFALEYDSLKKKLQAACAADSVLAPLGEALKHDVFETRVFREVVHWFEACHRAGKLPDADSTRRQMLLQIGREMGRRGLGSLVNRLAQAYVRRA